MMLEELIIKVRESEKQQKLKEYKLDEKSIKELKDHIKNVSKEESNKLGKELFDMLSDKNYKDDKFEETALELIYKGADVNYKMKVDPRTVSFAKSCSELTKTDVTIKDTGDFPLLICARKGYFNTFFLLLRAGADINQKNNYLTTATMAAARHGNYEMLEILILMGADINAKCLDGDTALISAARHGRHRCVSLLVQNQAHLNTKSVESKYVFDFYGVEIDQNLLEDMGNLKNTSVTKEEVDLFIKEAEKRFNEIKNK